jgi:hypothetical protein
MHGQALRFRTGACDRSWPVGLGWFTYARQLGALPQCVIERGRRRKAQVDRIPCRSTVLDHLERLVRDPDRNTLGDERLDDLEEPSLDIHHLINARSLPLARDLR